MVVGLSPVAVIYRFILTDLKLTNYFLNCVAILKISDLNIILKMEFYSKVKLRLYLLFCPAQRAHNEELIKYNRRYNVMEQCNILA